MASHSTVLPYRVSTFDLQLFAAVAKAGSITLGAKNMHLSLAAASMRLQKMEHLLGATLLHRSKLGVTLTDAGRTLLRHAGRLERGFEDLHAEMAGFAHGMRSTIRVLCNTAAMTEYLPPLIGRFLSTHEDIDIELRELGSQDVLQAMRQEQADIGIVADYVDTEGLTTQFFRADRLVVLSPSNITLSAKPKIAFSELLSRPFVGLPSESGLSRFLQSQAINHGRGLHYRVRVRCFEAVVSLVKNGVGIAIVPETTADRLSSKGLQSKQLADAWANRKLLLCTPAESTTDGRASEFVSFLSNSGYRSLKHHYK